MFIYKTAYLFLLNIKSDFSDSLKKTYSLDYKETLYIIRYFSVNHKAAAKQS